jgi:uncharacterized membrane protein required for colicin V production
MVLTGGMSIWILALLLLAAGAGMGFKQGAIRAAISFAGILVSALLAWPLSGLIAPLLPHLGVHNRIAAWLLPPFIVFVILLIVFKSFGQFVHHKAEVYYKYKVADVQLILWQHLIKRLAIGFGLLNGLVYLVLISVIIYDFSYWTVQVAPSDSEGFLVRLLNRMGRDLDVSGLAKAARALNPLPADYFRAADLAGMLYQNPQLKDRLANYPAFLSLNERDDFKALGQDGDFQNAWKTGSPIGQLLNNPAAAAIWRDMDKGPALLRQTMGDYDDLVDYLKTGRSAKYDPMKILGRWEYNLIASLNALERSQPNLKASEMETLRALWPPAYAKTTLMAGADGQVFVKSLPNFSRPAQGGATVTADWHGRWSGDGGDYTLSLNSGNANKSATAAIAGSQLIIKTGGEAMVFDREN